VALRFLALPSRRFAIPSPVFAFTAVPFIALPFLCLSDQLFAFPSHGFSLLHKAYPPRFGSVQIHFPAWLFLIMSFLFFAVAYHGLSNPLPISASLCHCL
jgi:hypothetical protein